MRQHKTLALLQDKQPATFQKNSLARSIYSHE